MNQGWRTWLKRRILWGLVGLLGPSTRLVRINWQVMEALEAGDAPYLIGFWHNNILSAVHTLKHRDLPAMISRSKDGDDIAWVLARFGFEGLRGSASAGGLGVMRDAMRRLAGGKPVIVTPDGPRGPRYRVKPGIVSLARKRGVPIVPMAWSHSRRWEFGSWDRMRLPKFFSTVTVLVGDPLFFDGTGSSVEDREAFEEVDRLRLEESLRHLTRVAEAYTGMDERAPDSMLTGESS